MEASNTNGVDQDGLQGKPLSLSVAIIEAVSEAISNATGRMLVLQPGFFAPSEENEVDPAQIAMAVAYTNLCIEEPEMVTSRHKKMLRSAFSYEQIQDLNGLIKKMLQ